MIVSFLTNAVFETAPQVSTHITMPKEINEKQLCERPIGSSHYFSLRYQLILLLSFWTTDDLATILSKSILQNDHQKKESVSWFIEFEQMFKKGHNENIYMFKRLLIKYKPDTFEVFG